MSKTTTTKGKPQLALNGYLYNVFATRDDGVISWRCVKRDGGWVKENDGKFEEYGEHNHNPSAAA